MINRVFKTILILSLCLGITIPANAAVSVADGSAFVTKAEFTADLNNLSNRMAQLENSLDSTIDSLVSSYLTRNGIWNGAKQTLINNQTNWTGFWNESGTLSLDALRYHTTNSDFIGVSNSCAKIAAYNPNNESNKLDICTVNKSGLACVVYDVVGSYAYAVSGGSWANARICGTTSNNYYCLQGATATAGFAFGVGSEIKMNVRESVSFTGHIGLRFKSSSNNSQYFFINKNDKLCAWSNSVWSGSTAYGFWADPVRVHNEGFMIRLKIKDISIY